MFVCAECGASQPMQAHCAADGSLMQPIGDDLLLGTTVGAYRVARLLGVGGMGRVYKGVHPQIGSRVAIKVLSRECSDRRDLVERFFSEAKAVNLIRHESIVNVLDLATLPDGRPYIVMEYLDGAPLAGIIEHARHTGTRLPIGGLARLIAEVLDALGAAHAKGIIHRDLKPDNIFVTPAGRAKVLDFGIAKLQPELGGSATHTGSLLGTPHYMSPEQAAGRPVDVRADIYAIGVILFECATLHKPFVADSLFDLLRKHVEAPPPSPRALRPDMPPPLEQLIYSALAKLPEQRFASAHAMSMALQHATMSLPADQWTPIVPPNSARSPQQGSWQSTPPASWGGAPRSSVALGPTQATGQVTPATSSSSKKGLWLALGALLLVGGGVTAGVLASKGNTSSDATIAQQSGSADGAAAAAGLARAAGTGSGSAGTAGGGGGGGAGGAGGAGGDPWGDGTQAGSAVVRPLEPKQPVTPQTSDDDVDADDDDDEIPDEIFEATLASLPPAARKHIDAAIKKHGGWSKIPKSQRTQLLADAMRLATEAATRDVNAAFAGDSRATPARPQVTSAPRGGLGPDGWVVSNRFAGPRGYAFKNAHPDKYLPWALAAAKKLVPDAVLFRIDVSAVYPDGHADLSLDDNGSIDFRFISPSRMKGDPSKPLGAKQEKKCMFRIMLDEQGAWAAPLNGWDCKEALIGPPKCSVVQVWKKALARGAPSNAVATLGYRDWQKVAKWYFSIEGTKFSEVFNDDCR